MAFHHSGASLVGIGLGGICEGWLPPLLLTWKTGTLAFANIILIDGKVFSEANQTRQHFSQRRSKAQERCELWGRLYPTCPLNSLPQIVTAENVAKYISEGSAVLLSPDNHATRKVVSDHACRLQNCLLICGGNSDINKETGSDGSEGTVLVHYRKEGRDLTPPITKYHCEIADPQDELPTEKSCLELAAGQPQLLATNLLVGQIMSQMLLRYCLQDDGAASQVVEQWVNSTSGAVVTYSLGERSP